MRLVDFHMHTTHSDGSYTPGELMKYCKEKNLSCVSVTDHDTMSSFEECEREAKKYGIELVPGVEISVQFEPGTLHILGFFLDRTNPQLQKKFEEIQRARRERNPEIIRKLNQLGIEITLEEVTRQAYGEASIPAGKRFDRLTVPSKVEGQLGRPHFAKALVKKGVVKNFDEAFEKYLSKGKSAYVDKRRVSSSEALRIINDAGGVASVAHPKQMKLNEAELEKGIGRLVEEGLGAVEVYNSCQKPRENEIYRRIAKRFDLVATGGSDFHGANKPDVDLGFLGENVRLGYEMVEALRERIRKRK